MVRSILLFLILLFCLYSCDLLTDSTTNRRYIEELPAITVEWDETQSIVCFGTSLTFGLESVGESVYVPTTMMKGLFFNYQQADSSYPFLLNNRLKIKVHNQGHPGATVGKAISILSDSVLTKNPALVLLEFSANDFLRENDLVNVEDGMHSLIDSILDFGSQVILLSFVDKETLNNPPKEHVLYEKIELARDYFGMLERLSEEYNLLLVKDCFLGIFGIDDFMSDSVHPNNEGYIKMENNIYTSLYKTFEFNNMLK